MKINWVDNGVTEGFGMSTTYPPYSEYEEVSYCEYQVTISGRYKCENLEPDQPETGEATRRPVNPPDPTVEICYKVIQTCYCRTLVINTAGDSEKEKEKFHTRELDLGWCNSDGERSFHFRETKLTKKCHLDGVPMGADGDGPPRPPRCPLNHRKEYKESVKLKDIYPRFYSGNSRRLLEGPLFPGEAETAKKCGGLVRPSISDGDMTVLGASEETKLCMAKTVCPKCPEKGEKEPLYVHDREYGRTKGALHALMEVLSYDKKRCGEGYSPPETHP